MLNYISRALAVVALFVVAALAVACDIHGSGAADTPSDKKAAGTTAQVTGADREFAIKTTQVGNHEVELGRLAADRASDSDVKSFASRMVRDHTSAGDELTQITSRLGISVPKEDESSFKQLFDRLSKLTGAEFDRAYMSEMVEGHMKAASEIGGYGNNGNNSDLKAWASKTAPVIREHLQMAQNIAARIGAKP